MAKTSPTVTGLVIILVIAVAGLGYGYYASMNQISALNAQVSGLSAQVQAFENEYQKAKAAETVLTYWASLTERNPDKTSAFYGASSTLVWVGGALQGNYTGAGIKNTWTGFFALWSDVRLKISNLQTTYDQASDTAVVKARVIFDNTRSSDAQMVRLTVDYETTVSFTGQQPLITVSRFVNAAPAQVIPSLSTTAFKNDMRKLWEDHITWTRVVIVSVGAGLDDLDENVARLLQNQADIGDAVKPFYGDEAGDQLTALLEVHITGAAEVLLAAKSGNAAAFDAATTAWYENADDIATFLSSANPQRWPLDTLKSIMKEHLDLTLEEASAYLSGDYAASIQSYEEVHLHILSLADALSDGIIKQFPEMFIS